MAHKNLLTERKIADEVDIILDRKPSKCWALKKVRYKNFEAANKTLVYQQQIDKEKKLSVYKCKVCHSWHLTSH